MGHPITPAEFEELFSGFSTSAFRLETLEAYREPREQDALARFLAGQQPDDQWITTYLEMLRRARAEGRRVERVRVLYQPPTDYQRFVMDLAARCNVPAGEDLRVLDHDHAVTLDVPLGTDFWLFDDRYAALMRFDKGRFLGAELIREPDMIAWLRDLRRRTWEAAQPNRAQDFVMPP